MPAPSSAVIAACPAPIAHRRRPRADAAGSAGSVVAGSSSQESVTRTRPAVAVETGLALPAADVRAWIGAARSRVSAGPASPMTRRHVARRVAAAGRLRACRGSPARCARSSASSRCRTGPVRTSARCRSGGPASTSTGTPSRATTTLPTSLWLWCSPLWPPLTARVSPAGAAAPRAGEQHLGRRQPDVAGQRRRGRRRGDPRRDRSGPAAAGRGPGPRGRPARPVARCAAAWACARRVADAAGGPVQRVPRLVAPRAGPGRRRG